MLHNLAEAVTSLGSQRQDDNPLYGQYCFIFLRVLLCCTGSLVPSRLARALRKCQDTATADIVATVPPLLGESGARHLSLENRILQALRSVVVPSTTTVDSVLIPLSYQTPAVVASCAS